MLKTCKACEKQLSTDKFFKNNSSKDGFMQPCKSCKAIIKREKAYSTRLKGKHSIYIITHPKFEGWIKLGRAKNPIDRLKGYQTYCPHRAYTLEYYVKVQTPLFYELYFQNKFMSLGYEWFEASVEDAVEAINLVKATEEDSLTFEDWYSKNVK